MADPQLAETYGGEALPYPHWIEPKLDGLRAIARVEDGKAVFTSRKGNLFYNTEGPASELAQLKWPDGTLLRAVFDGELYAGSWETTASVCRRSGRHPESGSLIYVAFDVMPIEDWEAGVSHYAQRERFQALLRLLDITIGDNGEAVLSSLKRVTVPGGLWVSTPQEAVEIARGFLDSGYEGAMLKDPEAPYQRKRNTAWRKIKFTERYDLPIIGVQPGKSRFQGSLGALVLAFNGGETECGTGFNENERDALWKMHEAGNLIGKIVEVRAQKVTPGQHLFATVYLRLREDK